MKRPSTPLAVAALTALLLPTSPLHAVPTDNAALTALLEEALINVQCEGTTANTGSLSLGDGNTGNNGTNGLVSEGAWLDTILNVSTAFFDAWNPASQCVDFAYLPYIGASTLMNAMRSAGLAGENDFCVPEWTISTRVMMPEYEDTVVLAIGANHSGLDDGYQALGSLVVTVEKIADNRGNSANGDDTTGDTLRLWYITDGTYGHDGEGHEVDITNQVQGLGRAKVPCLTDSFHLLTVRYKDHHVDLFLDDRLVISRDIPTKEGAPGPLDIAPGLQYGQLMGRSNISSEFDEWFPYFKTVEDRLDGNDGGIDFLLFYNRLLSNEEIYTLARAYPYIHRDEGNHGSWVESENSYVRYIRRVNVDINGYAELNWVSDGAWVRQYTWNGTWWPSLDGDEDDVNANRYDEPAEGAIVAIECVGGGTVKFLVNTEKIDFIAESEEGEERAGFPSADRTYAQLEVTGEGTVKIGPCSGWESTTGDSTTLDSTRASGYQYGTLYFTGGAGDDLDPDLDGDRGESNNTAAAIFETNAEVWASVCDFSNDEVQLKGTPQVTFHADTARVRGLEGPVVKCQLTQRITGDAGESHGSLGKNATVNLDYAQASEAVCVPTYDENDTWLITDKTEVHNLSNTDAFVFSRTGLVAWYFNQIEPLYLDLADVPESVGGSASEDEHAFSKQPWRRGDYTGEKIAEDEVEETFQHAARLNVRLSHDRTVSPLIVNAAKRAKSLTVELPDGGAKSDVLRLVSRNNGLLTLSETLDVDGTLRVFDYDKKVDAVKFLGNTKLTGEGVFAACNMTFSGLNIDIGTIRSEGKLTFGQDVPNTILAAGGDATLATTEPNRQAKGLNLNKTSILDCSTANASASAFTVETVEATLPVRVTAPDNAFHGLVFLRSEEKTADMDSREAFQAAHRDGDKWDIRVDVVEDGSVFFFDEAGFAEPTDPTDGTDGGENTWVAELEETLIDIYQSQNLIGGEAEGYTQGKEKVLSASDISDALLCFRNVAALATHGEGTPSTRAAAETEHSDDYAAVADLIVAYEFGISRATIVKDESGNEQVLVEVTLRNDLATDFAGRVDHIKDPAEFTDTDTTENIEDATPAYAEGTTLVFSVNGKDIDAGSVIEETVATCADGTSLTRRFYIPLSAFSEAATNAERLEFSVRAEPPKTTSEAQAAYLKSLF